MMAALLIVAYIAGACTGIAVAARLLLREQ